MSEDFIIYMVLGLGGVIVGCVAGFKLGYAYAMRVSQGFDLVTYLKSFIPFSMP